MARKVFFSFHYEADNWRASIVRNSGLTKAGLSEAGFIDSAAWEQLKRQGDERIERWINTQMNGTTVTAVLIGSNTCDRDWVNYEIKRTLDIGNGILGIRIHQIRDKLGQTCLYGRNPFDNFQYRDDFGVQQYLSKVVKTYDWISDNGYVNFGTWVESAAKQQGL